MTGEELAKQIEESDLTEEELEVQGWGRICGGLPPDLADIMKRANPARIKIPDVLNPGEWLVMEIGYRHDKPKPDECNLQAKEKKPEEVVNNKPVNSQEWFDF